MGCFTLQPQESAETLCTDWYGPLPGIKPKVHVVICLQHRWFYLGTPGSFNIPLCVAWTNVNVSWWKHIQPNCKIHDVANLNSVPFRMVVASQLRYISPQACTAHFQHPRAYRPVSPVLRQDGSFKTVTVSPFRCENAPQTAGTLSSPRQCLSKNLLMERRGFHTGSTHQLRSPDGPLRCNLSHSLRKIG
jgi:hypothetical protein